MRQIEVKAKTAHEAIEDACNKLGVTQDQVTVEILSQGGIFGGKMKVLVTVKEDAEAAKKEIAAKVKNVNPEPLPEPVTKKSITKDAAPKSIEAAAPAPRTARVSVGERRETDKRVPQAPAANEKDSGAASPVASNSPKFIKTLAFTKKLLELLDNDSQITTEITDESFNININGENIGRLIGKNGAVLNAIQTLISSIAISNSSGEGKRVFVNIGNYKEKRGDTLLTLANKKAEYVKKTGRFVKLEPMNARERAIIHTALQGVEGIKTYSTGRDPFRCLCIAPSDGSDKPSKTAEVPTEE